MTDYSGYEVHKTRPDWNGELIAVLKNGNRGRIVSMTTGEGDLPTVFQVQMSEIGRCEVYEREIDHYLTPPKPKKMPDHEGLWKDKDGDLWVYNGCDLRLVKNVLGWTVDGSFTGPEFIKRYAPFTELEVKEKHQ